MPPLTVRVLRRARERPPLASDHARRRLGVEGDWAHRYATFDYEAEAVKRIADRDPAAGAGKAPGEYEGHAKPDMLFPGTTGTDSAFDSLTSTKFTRLLWNCGSDRSMTRAA